MNEWHVAFPPYKWKVLEAHFGVQIILGSKVRRQSSQESGKDGIFIMK